VLQHISKQKNVYGLGKFGKYITHENRLCTQLYNIIGLYRDCRHKLKRRDPNKMKCKILLGFA